METGSHVSFKESDTDTQVQGVNCSVEMVPAQNWLRFVSGVIA